MDFKFLGFWRDLTLLPVLRLLDSGVLVGFVRAIGTRVVKLGPVKQNVGLAATPSAAGRVVNKEPHAASEWPPESIAESITLATFVSDLASSPAKITRYAYQI